LPTLTSSPLFGLRGRTALLHLRLSYTQQGRAHSRARYNSSPQ
jgi:hypothetical protein